jgi:hypothetical protein
MLRALTHDADGHSMTDLDRVLGYARHGWPMVPVHGAVDGRCTCGDAGCGSPAKHPLTRHGLSDASTDLDVITGWARRWPWCNWAGRTGVVADVLDVDPGGMAALATLAGQRRMPPVIWRVATTGRGLHLYLPPNGAGNATGGRAGWPEHLDYRGRGGYVLMEPSRHVSGRLYYFRPSADLAGDLAGVAERVPVPIAMPWETPAPRSPATPAGRQVLGDGRTSPYGRAVLDRVCRELAATGEGAREVTMSQVAVMTAARAIEGGHLDRETAIREIEDAARACGLRPGEVAKGGRVLSRIGPITHPIAPPENSRSDVERLADWIARQPLVTAHRGLLKALRGLDGPTAEDDARILAAGGRRAGIPDHLVDAAVKRALNPVGAGR